jgi:RNA polymerase sigma-70 factor (ECF subfamily)
MKKAAAIQTMERHVYHLATEATQDQLDGADVVKVLQGLKPEHRELIDMAYYQGYTQQEIAERTSLPLGTVKSRTRAALTELRTLLKDHQ